MQLKYYLHFFPLESDNFMDCSSTLKINNRQNIIKGMSILLVLCGHSVSQHPRLLRTHIAFPCASVSAPNSMRDPVSNALLIREFKYALLFKELKYVELCSTSVF